MKNTSRILCIAIIDLFALSLFDAMVGGGITMALRLDGWTDFDQRAITMHQLGFGMIVLVYFIFRARRNSVSVIITIAMLFGYVEDLLYFVMLPVASPLISYIVGSGYDGINFPDKIAGWIGWASRVVWHGNFSLAFDHVLLLNALSVVLVTVFLKIRPFKNNDRRSLHFSD